ncbi:MAG: YfiT family bacillithiol transferase, partial [Gemmatimonadales bacterium]
GWTVRQVAHHVPDSHMNAYIRMKLAVTEEAPVIKTYEEKRWAELADAKTPDVEMSLRLLEALHQRWVLFLRSLGATDFARPLSHPEMGHITVDYLVSHYAWHGKHHVAHVTSLRERMGW